MTTMSPVDPGKFVLPREYTFTSGGVLIHEAAWRRTQRLFERAKNRNPDRHGMYIYNDFFGYAILDLIDETLSSVHTHIAKKRYMDSWHVLDALAQFIGVYGDWTQVDDGERVVLTEKAQGALIVTTIRGLESLGQLSEESIPNLETSLKIMAGWAEMMSDTLDTSYHIVLKGYGKKLFGERTEDDRKKMLDAREEAYKAFVQNLSPEERKQRGDMPDGELNDSDEDEDEDDDDGEKGNGPKTWFGDAKTIDADLKDSSYRVTPTWKEYRGYLSGCPRLPMRGPPDWDLTHWPAKEKRQFSYDDDAVLFSD